MSVVESSQTPIVLGSLAQAQVGATSESMPVTLAPSPVQSDVGFSPNKDEAR